jgi:hypothetical protein
MLMTSRSLCTTTSIAIWHDRARPRRKRMQRGSSSLGGVDLPTTRSRTRSKGPGHRCPTSLLTFGQRSSHLTGSGKNGCRRDDARLPGDLRPLEVTPLGHDAAQPFCSSCAAFRRRSRASIRRARATRISARQARCFTIRIGQWTVAGRNSCGGASQASPVERQAGSSPRGPGSARARMAGTDGGMSYVACTLMAWVPRGKV